MFKTCEYVWIWACDSLYCHIYRLACIRVSCDTVPVLLVFSIRRTRHNTVFGKFLKRQASKSWQRSQNLRGKCCKNNLFSINQKLQIKQFSAFQGSYEIFLIYNEVVWKLFERTNHHCWMYWQLGMLGFVPLMWNRCLGTCRLRSKFDSVGVCAACFWEWRAWVTSRCLDHWSVREWTESKP